MEIKGNSQGILALTCSLSMSEGLRTSLAELFSFHAFWTDMQHQIFHKSTAACRRMLLSAAVQMVLALTSWGAAIISERASSYVFILNLCFIYACILLIYTNKIHVFCSYIQTKYKHIWIYLKRHMLLISCICMYVHPVSACICVGIAYMCMYVHNVYIFLYLLVCICIACISMYLYWHLQTPVCVCICMYEYISICICRYDICACICMYWYVCECMTLYVSVSACIYMYLHVCACMHILMVI